MHGPHKTTLKLEVLTLFHQILSPQQRGSKSACLYTSFQNLRTYQLDSCRSDHTWQQFRSCKCTDRKGKGKFHHITGHKDPEKEQRCSSTLSVILTIDGSGWSAPRPDHFTPRKRRGTNFIGGWMGLGSGLDGWEKSRPHRDSNPEQKKEEKRI